MAGIQIGASRGASGVGGPGEAGSSSGGAAATVKDIVASLVKMLKDDAAKGQDAGSDKKIEQLLQKLMEMMKKGGADQAGQLPPEIQALLQQMQNQTPNQ